MFATNLSLAKFNEYVLKNACTELDHGALWSKAVHTRDTDYTPIPLGGGVIRIVSTQSLFSPNPDTRHVNSLNVFHYCASRGLSLLH